MDRRSLLALTAVIAIGAAIVLGTRMVTSGFSPAPGAASPNVSPGNGGAQGSGTLPGAAIAAGNAGGTHTVTSSTIPDADWRAGLTRDTDIENALFANPDPTRVGDFATNGCTCNAEAVSLLTNLKNKKWRVAGPNIKINHATEISQPSANQVKVAVDLQPSGYATVDAQGNQVEAAPVGATPLFIYILERGTDGQWRIADRSPYTGA